MPVIKTAYKVQIEKKKILTKIMMYPSKKKVVPVVKIVKVKTL